MRYDIFISYSRRDNDKGQVAGLVERIAKQFEAFAGRRLEPFFDVKEISGGEYWQDKILTGLKDSRLMLACLSPEYLKSQWCEWEFNEYQKYELGRAFLGKGVAPIYFVKVPGFEDAGFESACAEWVAKLRRRQFYDLRSWLEEGEAALQRTDVAMRLEDLTHQVWEQVRLGELAENRKGNLDRANARFVGRVQEMERLHKLVGLGKGVGVLTAVNGLGGIGKTALVLQYAHAYGDMFAGGCWQISCEGRTDLMAAFGSLVGQRDMDFELTEEEKKSVELQFERVLRELQKRADAAREEEKTLPAGRRQTGNRARVLVLLDNVDKAELLAEEQTCRLPQAQWLCLLATTRLGPEELEGIEDEDFLAVDELLEEDALALIESYQSGRRYKGKAQRDAALEIVRLLGRMPLAVEVAAVYMGECKISCEAFLARLHKDGQEYFAQVEKGKKGKVRHGEKCLGITLRPTLEQLRDEERLALEYAALLPADHVPLPWLRALVSKEFPECGQDAEIGLSDPWLDVVRRLLSLRLLQETGVLDSAGNPLVVRMHRLVGDVVRHGLDTGRLEQRKELLDELTAERTIFLGENWLRAENRWELTPLVAMAELGMDKGDSLATDLALGLSSTLFSIGQYRIVRRLLACCLNVLVQSREPGHPDLGLAHNNLGMVDQALGNFPEAREHLEQALAIWERSLESGHPDLGLAHNNLGMVDQALGNFPEAREHLEQALAIWERSLEPGHPNLGMIHNNLGLVAQTLGNFPAAREHFEQALAIYQKVYAPDNPTLVAIYSSLVTTEQALGNFSDAAAYQEKYVSFHR